MSTRASFLSGERQSAFADRFGGKQQRFTNVPTLQVRVIGEDLARRLTRGDETDDGRDRYPQPTQARDAPICCGLIVIRLNAMPVPILARARTIGSTSREPSVTSPIRIDGVLPYVYAKADAQRGRKGGSGRQALRGCPRHVGLAAR